jgi:hypothetical protein
MKYLLTTAILAALVAAPLRADDKPKDKPKDEKPTVQKKFQEITQEFEKAQEPLIKEFQAAKTDEEKEAVIALRGEGLEAGGREHQGSRGHAAANVRVAAG